MSTYVGKWDCPACGTKRIPGWKDGRTVERCPACGAPCTKKWYLDDRKMVIANPEEVAKAKSKRAWTCGHCDHVNDAEDLECDACGNPKDLSTDDKQLIARRYKGTNAPTKTEEVADLLEEGVTDQSSARQDAEIKWPKGYPNRYPEAEKQAKRKNILKKGIMFGGSGTLLLALIVSLFIRTECDVTVSGFAWERTVSIQDYGPRSYSSWDYPPSGAYNVSSAQEVHHYDRIYEGRECHTESYSYVCGTVDNGNGTFSDEYCTDTREVCEDIYRDEPVYATKYYYDIDEWAHHHNVEAAGEDKNPYWPTDPLTTSHPGTWRDGGKSGTYYVVVTDGKGKAHKEEVGEGLWDQTTPNSTVKGYKNRFFGFWMGLKEDGR